MSREIKFRAWDKQHHEWLGADAWYVRGSSSVLVIWPEVKKGFQVSVNMETLGAERVEITQYTGLKDKNGAEIYQGDLVRVTADVEAYGATSYGGMVEVTTKTCGYSLKPVSPTLEEIDTHTLYHDSGELMVWDSSSFWHVDEPTNLEVIGNIYETPKLLKDAS